MEIVKISISFLLILLNKPCNRPTMRLINLPVLVILLLTACNPKSQEKISGIKSNEIKLAPPVRLRLSDCINKTSENLELSDIAESISYIKLETNEESLLGGIVFVVPIDDGYLISDNSWSLYLFGKNGKFKWKINNQGRGPTEYLEISDLFGADNIKREIILSDGKKLLIYDFNSNFKRKISLPFYPGNVCVLPSGHYLLTNTNPFETALARVTDGNGNVVKKYINSNVGTRLDDKGRGLKSSRSEFRFNYNEVLLSNRDTIWQLIDNMDLEVRFIIDSRLKENKDRFYFYSSNVISKSLIGLIFHFQKENFLYDIKDKTFYNVNGGLPDDIDFGPNVFPGRGDGRILIDFLNPFTLLSISSSIRKASDLFNIVQNMKEDDNPILRIIKLKE